MPILETMEKTQNTRNLSHFLVRLNLHFPNHFRHHSTESDRGDHFLDTFSDQQRESRARAMWRSTRPIRFLLGSVSCESFAPEMKDTHTRTHSVWGIRIEQYHLGALWSRGRNTTRSTVNDVSIQPADDTYGHDEDGVRTEENREQTTERQAIPKERERASQGRQQGESANLNCSNVAVLWMVFDKLVLFCNALTYVVTGRHHTTQSPH